MIKLSQLILWVLMGTAGLIGSMTTNAFASYPKAPGGCWKESFGNQLFVDGVFWAFVDTSVISKEDLVAILSEAYESWNLTKSFPGVEGTQLNFALSATVQEEGESRSAVQTRANEEIRKLQAMNGVTVTCMGKAVPHPGVTGSN